MTIMLETALDRALEINVLFEQTEGDIFTRTEWMTADPELAFTLASSVKFEVLINAIKKLAVDVGEESVVFTINKLKKDEDYVALAQLVKKAKQEANDNLPEIVSKIPSKTLPAKLQRALKKGPLRKGFGLSKADAEKRNERQREILDKQAKRAVKKYRGDTIWGIFKDDQLIKGNYPNKQYAEIEVLDRIDLYPPGYEVKEYNDPKSGDAMWGIFKDNQLIKGDFSDNEKAESAIYNRPDLYPPQYQVKEYENPKSLTKLRETFLPAEKGWTTDEIVAAMMPYIYKMAWKYKSERIAIEDLVQQGVWGVLNAIPRDEGKTPFTAWAMKFLKRHMLRVSLTAGIIKGQESPTKPIAGEATPEKEREKMRAAVGVKPGISFKNRGALVGYHLIWADTEDEIHTQFFNVEDLTKGKIADPGYKKMREFGKKLIEKGEVKKDINPKTKEEYWVIFDEEETATMKFISATKGQSDDEEREKLGLALKATKTKSPAYIAQYRDYIEDLLQDANLNPRQDMAIRLAYGFDIPQRGVGEPGVFGEPETYEKEKEPGKHAGLCPSCKKPFSTDWIKGAPPQKCPHCEYELGGKKEVTKSRAAPKIGGGPQAERGFADIAKIMGLDKSSTEDLVKKALIKIQKALLDKNKKGIGHLAQAKGGDLSQAQSAHDQKFRERLKHETESLRKKEAAEAIEELRKFMIVESYIINTTLHWLIKGDLNHIFAQD